MAFVIMHLAGSAREWGTAMWDNRHECCSSYSNFSQELRKVFDRSALGNEAARALSLLRQGTRTVSDYAIEFRTLAASSGWNSRALWDHFLHGLAEQIRTRSTPRSCPPHSMDWSNSPLGWIFAWRSGHNTAIRTGVRALIHRPALEAPLYHGLGSLKRSLCRSAALISRPGNGGIGLPTGCVSTAERRAI